MKKLCMIACDNGLGHISRTIDLANLLQKKYKITLCSDKKKIKKIKKIKKKNKFKSFHLKLNQFTQFNNSKLDKKFLKSFDLVYTDNIIVKNLLKKNLFVYANFFWHQVLNYELKRFKKIEDFLLKNKIKIIGNYMFQNVKGSFNFKKVSFFGKFEGTFKTNKNILLSFGTANIHYKKKKLIINELKKILTDKDLSSYNFYIDKDYVSIMKHNKIYNFQAFDYSKKMFGQMSLAIIKPGFGIINDCFKFGIPVCPLNLYFNKEFKQNSFILKKNKLILFQTSLKDLKKNLKISYEYKKLYILYKKYRSLKWFGEQEIIKILSNS